MESWRRRQKEARKLLHRVRELLQPRSNQIYARYELRCREQEDAEKFEHYVTSLKLLLNECGYDAAIHDEMIRESIVFGVKSSKIRQKLINEGSDLTLQKCLDIARTYELSQEQLKVIDNQASIHYVKSKRSAKRQPRGRAEQRPTATQPIQRVLPGPAATKIWTNSGRHHYKKDTCPTRGQQCNYCLKFDHFATVCRSKRDSKQNINLLTARNVHYLVYASTANITQWLRCDN